MNYLKVILIFINIFIFSDTYGQCCVIRIGDSPAYDISINFGINYQPNNNNNVVNNVSPTPSAKSLPGQYAA